MNIAGLNVRIVIQRCVTIKDRVGNHKNEWQDYFSCYATVIDKSGDEEESAALTKVRERKDFTVRFSSETAAVEPDKYRIVMKEKIYNIKSVDDMAFKMHSRKFHTERTDR